MLPEHDQLKYPLAIFLDEVAALGKIPILAEAIRYMPGCNVRLALIAHTSAQLREVHGAHNAETVLKSFAARILFAPKDFADAKEISDKLGTTTSKPGHSANGVFLISEKRVDRDRAVSR